MLHERYDFPMMNLHGITLTYGFDLRVTMQPDVIISEEDVRGVNVNQRDCLFDGEVAKSEYSKNVLKCIAFIETIHLVCAIQSCDMHSGIFSRSCCSSLWLSPILFTIQWK